MKRRDFIALLGGAAVAWPLAASAQQGERMRRIGVLMNTTENEDQQASVAGFRQVLQQLGWSEGRNLRIDIRWGEGRAAEIRRHAGELAALAPDVLFCTGTAGLAPLLQATRTIPIVFVEVADPVGAGYVDSLAQPGGNVTGFLQFEYSLSGKWLELLKEITPRNASGGASGCRHQLRDRPIRRHSGGGTNARGGCQGYQHARCR